MGVLSGGVDMTKQEKLSEERLELIRRFMGEPPQESVADDEVAEPALEPARPAVRPPTANGKPPADPAQEPAARVATAAPRIPMPVRARVLWHRLDLRWPLAVLVLGAVVGILLAR
jgi:hypothetical protein